jgi:hypothetical protein
VLGLHATPDSSGPSQSPLAAIHTCARLPYVSARSPPKRSAAQSAVQANAWCLCSSGRTTFQRLSTSWSDRFQPRGSRAPIWASSGTSRKPDFADCSVCNQPLTVGASQSPPKPSKKATGSRWSGAAPFHPENPGRLSFFSRILTDEILAERFTREQRRGRRGKPATPARQAVQGLPTCCCGSLGTLRSTTRKCMREHTNRHFGLNRMTPE